MLFTLGDVCFSNRPVERCSHHLVSAPRYRAGSVDLARAGQSKHRPDRLGLSEPNGYVNCSPIGQRHYRADTGERYQTPAHIIVSDDGQQAAVQYAKLRAKETMSNGSTNSATSGRLSTSPLTRARHMNVRNVILSGVTSMIVNPFFSVILKPHMATNSEGVLSTERTCDGKA